MGQNKEEIVKYLANVYYVVLADGVVERVEERVFEEIAREFQKLSAKGNRVQILTAFPARTDKERSVPGTRWHRISRAHLGRPR